MNARLWISAAAAVAMAFPLAAQQRFDTPEAAAQALIEAADHHDSARLAAIFGPQSAPILTSGDVAQDKGEQSEFARLARTKHRLEYPRDNPNRAVLSIGGEDWPFPVPMVRTNGKWSFDNSGAEREMHARRIGTNELDAIEICQGYVEAQKQYATKPHNGMLVYAVSANQGLDVPSGFAQAIWTGAQRGSAKPYHGYYFRVLDGQGPHAAGGAHRYIVNGRLMGGFGLVAWPAEYGVTGILTFVVNQDGLVYEKDNEPITGKPTPSILRFDPDNTWKPVD